MEILKTVTLVFLSIAATTSSSYAHDPVALEKKAKSIASNASILLGSQIVIQVKTDAASKAFCMPEAKDGAVFLCWEFFKFLSTQIPEGEQESALAFVLSHEIMHLFIDSYYFQEDELVSQLNSSKDQLSETLWLLGHLNVDWGATKLMLAMGYTSIEPAIRFLFKHQEHPHLMRDPALARYIDQFRKESLIRAQHLRRQFNEGLRGDSTFFKIMSPCSYFSVLSDSGELLNSGPYSLKLFLEKYMTDLSPPMLEQCYSFPASDIAKEIVFYRDRLTQNP